MKKKLREHDGWVKNTDTGAVSCTDQSEYAKYMRAYSADEKKRLELEALQNDVSGLKLEMSDIKSLLLTIVQNQKGLNHDD